MNLQKDSGTLFPAGRYYVKIAAVLLVLLSCSVQKADAYPQDDEITFIHIGDTHYNTRSDDYQEQRERFSRTIEIMNRIPGTPYPEELGGSVGTPFGVFVVGDLTESRQSDFDSFVEDWGLKGGDGLLDFPVYEGAGNHDGPSSTHPGGYVRRAIIERNPERPHLASLSENELHYSLDYKGVHFVQLNEYAGPENDIRYPGNPAYNRKGRAYGNPAELSLQFLEKTLSENVGNSGRPVVILQHYGFDGWPLSPWGDELAWWTEEHALRLWETIAGYNVIAILVGHGHNHSILDWNGIPVFQMDSYRGFGVYRIRDGELVRVVRNLEDDSWGEVSRGYSTSVFAGRPEELVQGPYMVYRDDPSEMTLLWRTDREMEVELRWGRTGFQFESGEKLASPVDNEYNLYRAVLTDLDPNARYTYQLKMGEKYELGMFYSAPDHNADRVKFMIYGSTAAGKPEHENISSALYDKIFDDPAYHSFLMHTGNWVPRVSSISSWDVNYFFYGSEKPYPAYIHKRMPVMGPAGHESGTSLAEKLFPYNYAEGPWYSFRYGPVHVTVIDPFSDLEEGSPQYEWLVNDLDSAEAPWSIVVAGSDLSDGKGHSESTHVYEAVSHICGEYGVDLLIGRSSEGYSRGRVGNTEYVGIGAGQYLPGPGSHRMYFATVQVEDGILSLQVFNDKGEAVPTLELKE